MKLSKRTWHTKLVRHLREWHRKLGIFAAFFLIFLSITGIALNHTDALSLAHKPIANHWLLQHYGIKAPNDLRFYPLALPPSSQKTTAIQNHFIIVSDNSVWFDEKHLFDTNEMVIGAGVLAPFIAIITEQQVYLFNTQGDLVDQLDNFTGVPENITHIRVEKNLLVVSTAQGDFQIDNNFLDWQAIPKPQPTLWLKSVVPPPKTKLSAIQQYKSQFLTLERIVVDAHSGRIFGSFGVFFMDVVAILLILLSVSGMYIWIRYARAKR
jgi:uncharacterized iron-regulated membrane protein